MERIKAGLPYRRWAIADAKGKLIEHDGRFQMFEHRDAAERYAEALREDAQVIRIEVRKVKQ